MIKIKQFITLQVIPFFVVVGIIVFTTSQIPPPKSYPVTLTLEQWNSLLFCLNKSRAEHTDVVALQELVLPQLQKQLQADTTKKK